MDVDGISFENGPEGSGTPAGDFFVVLIGFVAKYSKYPTSQWALPVPAQAVLTKMRSQKLFACITYYYTTVPFVL